jgi:menaquinone-dependent protoporphyrinogen oxidase
MRELKSLEEYTAVVLGAPLYMVHWHKDAHKFLSWHREALTNLPVAVFTLGPLDDKEEEWKEVRSQLEKEFAKFSWLKPVAAEVFGGKFDPEKLRFPDSLIARLPASPLHDMPASDIRTGLQSVPGREALQPGFSLLCSSNLNLR